MEQKKCLTCEKNIRGRSDKKFCNDYCRNDFNNKNRSVEDASVRYVNRILLRNRNILQQNLGKSRSIVKVKKETLIEEGFIFKYFTHTQKNKKGSNYILCYDHGYLSVTDEYCIIFSNDSDNIY